MLLRKKMLSVKTMVELENWLESLPDDIQDLFDDNDMRLPKRLKLKVEYVPASKLPPDTEAELRPIEDESYNGLIRICDSLKNSSFPYMHEIIHYLRDVGMGNRVKRVFARKRTGKTDTEDEQYVNYLTSSAIMRYRDMKKYIEEYDNSHPKMDELKFVNTICDRYGQDRVAVIRKIAEVRKLKAYRSR